MKDCATIEMKIFVGSRVGYTYTYMDEKVLHEVCQEYCNDVGLCVTVTKTHYIYKDGNEDGFIIGLINYPRFPSTFQEMWIHAAALANMLMKTMRQQRVSIMTPERTYMLENERIDKEEV